MSSLDEAFATPITVVRPGGRDPDAATPRAAVVVRYDGGRTVREAVLRGLLGRGWQLVAAPVGRFVFEDERPRAAAALAGDRLTIGAGREIVYEGPLALAADLPGEVWRALARGAGEVLVFVTVGGRPVLTAEDADRVARAGHLVGIAADLAEVLDPADQ